MADYIITNGQLHSTDELKHYGVLGMKWGVRKAYSYSRDLNAHRYNKKKQQLRIDKKAHKISKENYKSEINDLKNKRKRSDQLTRHKLSKITVDKNKSVKSIYEQYKDKAYREIPNYTVKRGAKTVSNIITGALGAAALNSAAVAGLVAAGLQCSVGGIAAAAAGAGAIKGGTAVMDTKIRRRIYDSLM